MIARCEICGQLAEVWKDSRPATRDKQYCGPCCNAEGLIPIVRVNRIVKGGEPA